MDFKEEGLFKFIIKCNGNVYLEMPLWVNNAYANKDDIKTIEYYVDYLK